MTECPVPEVEIRSALAHITASEPFRNAPQLVAFLAFVVDKKLLGKANEIKGYTIATEALGRPDDFDPQTDPIVRVEAGRLRRALDSYYQGQGGSDPVRILVPRGSYVPQFERAPAIGETDTAGQSPEMPRPMANSGLVPVSLAARPPGRRSGRRPTGMVLPLALGLFGLVCLLLAAGVTDRFQKLVDVPWFRNAAVEAVADVRPVIIVAPVETTGLASRHMSPVFLRAMIVDALARFDEVEVADMAAGWTRSAPHRYGLDLHLASTADLTTITARLTREPGGVVVWTRSFERPEPSDRQQASAEMEIAREIATTLGQPYGVLFTDLRTHPNLDARSRCIIQAYDYRNSPTAEAHAKARACLEDIVASRPNEAVALANLAYFYLDEHRVGHNPRPGSLDRALRAARRAVEIAPESPRANQALMAALFVRGDRSQAMQVAGRLLELNPYDTDVIADVGARFIQSGRYEEGANLIRRAAAANPAAPPWYSFFLFLAAYMQDDMETARAMAARITTNDYVLGLVARAIVGGYDGDMEQAQATIAQLIAIQPEFRRDPTGALARRQFAPDILQRLVQGLQQAGLRG